LANEIGGSSTKEELMVEDEYARPCASSYVTELDRARVEEVRRVDFAPVFQERRRH
jgi:hypothetical protein